MALWHQLKLTFSPRIYARSPRAGMLKAKNETRTIHPSICVCVCVWQLHVLETQIQMYERARAVHLNAFYALSRHFVEHLCILIAHFAMIVRATEHTVSFFFFRKKKMLKVTRKVTTTTTTDTQRKKNKKKKWNKQNENKLLENANDTKHTVRKCFVLYVSTHALFHKNWII